MKNNYKYKWKYNDEERPRGRCYDCGLNYTEFPDMIIPDELWEEINPTHEIGAGILCPTCIANRLCFINKWYGNNLYLLKKDDKEVKR